jgi:S-adenosylmethionine synthetase
MPTNATDHERMTQITIEQLNHVPAARRRTEHVERKGLGHPDTICDLVMEAASVALSRAYIDACGRVLHHNIDKGLLVAGQSAPLPGGGKILKPMRLIFGDRATASVNGRSIPVGQIVEETAQTWLREHLRFVDPVKHAIYQNEIQPGSPELVDIFAREQLTANDTSAAVGYAPFTETEQLVLEAEQYLNSPRFKLRFPEIGEDIKVMAFRLDRSLSLTVAAAFVDQFVPDARTYFERKAAVRDDLQRHLERRLTTLDALEVALNTLDDPARGVGGMYLTVLGTSADGADGGQVGRGNRVNGLISLHRPMSTEAAAGKNPVSHVGKIYNLLAHQMATRICASVAGVEEVNVWLCSQIGRPLADPWSVAVELVPKPETCAADLELAVQEVIHAELQNLPAFVARLTRGELPIC